MAVKQLHHTLNYRPNLRSRLLNWSRNEIKCCLDRWPSSRRSGKISVTLKDHGGYPHIDSTWPTFKRSSGSEIVSSARDAVMFCALIDDGSPFAHSCKTFHSNTAPKIVDKRARKSRNPSVKLKFRWAVAYEKTTTRCVKTCRRKALIETYYSAERSFKR